MIFATGPTAGKRQCRRAFTLIELILVLTLLAIAASLVAPMLSGFVRGRALDSEARRLLSVTRAAQSRAVSEGMPILLWVNGTQGSYGFEKEAVAQQSDPKAQQFEVDGNVRIAVVNLASGMTMLRNQPAIRFLPDDTVDENSPQIVRLNDATGAALWLVESRNRMSYEIHNTSP